MSIRLESVSKKFVLSLDRPRTLQESIVRRFGLRRGQNRGAEEFWAVRDVSFRVERGQMIGLIGDNGSGKSTLLKLFTGILTPTSGRISVIGRVAALLELGAGFHPDLTGRENIYLNGSILGLSKADIRVHLHDIIAFADIGQFMDTPLRHYSSGMQVRLGFAIATTLDPEILLIDEVLAVGDQAFQEKCISRIRQLHRNGVTVVFVSHDVDTVRKLCDRAIWMNEGQVRANGATDNVIGRYLQHVMSVGLSGAPLPTSNGRRWGSGETLIMEVEFLDADGQPRDLFTTGQTLVARIHYMAHQRVERPAFGVAIYGPDGEHLTGPNTALSRFEIPAIEGKGYVDYVVDVLPLMRGRYEFTAAIYDYASTHPYDHQHRLFTFTVATGTQPPAEGLAWIPCRWRHVPAAATASTQRPEPSP
jgi:ABC-type polysaccharide/polyol phosphate transport system ATPase subunit